MALCVVYYTYETIQRHTDTTYATTRSVSVCLSMLRGLTMCEQCEALIINGILCHEHGCPDAWKDYKRECTWCGQEFMPEYKDQTHCSEQCTNTEFSDQCGVH